MTEDEYSYSKSVERRWNEQVGAIVRRLHDLADEVEREGKLRAPSNYAPIPMLAAAANIHHAVAWGIPNLSLDHLVITATDYVMAVAQETKESRR